MKKLVYVLIAVSLMLALVPAAAFAHTEEEPFVKDLIAGGGGKGKSAIVAGDVSVWNDDDYLYVKYETHEPWCLLRTELHVGDELADIPQNQNNSPKMGEFEYQTYYEMDPCVTEETYQISLADHGLDYLEDVYIAAHAVVVDPTSEMTEVLVSEAGVDVYGPKGQYYGLNDSNWGTTAGSAVATWVHPSWPSIPGTTWISTAHYAEDPVNDSWRWFQDEMTLPEKGYYLSGSVVLATSDNAEEAYHNGVLIGSDGEIQGPFIDNHEWNTIVEYPFSPAKGLNTFDFIVRNYSQAGGSPTSNPTGLIYKVSATYYREETGWGDGERFRDKNWAMYITYNVQEPPWKFWNLPEDPVGLRIHAYPGTSNNYFDLRLWNVGTGYDISDGVWTGWCADEHVYIYYRDYTANVYSSYDPNLPSWASDDEQWDYINYILNHKHPSASMNDIQQAIWYFADAGYPMPTDTEAAAMVNDALANGAGFRPEHGDVGAVILAVRETVQLVFIEVDP